MKYLRQVPKGFTLLEMMLVMVIMAIIIVGLATYSEQRMLQLREDRTVLQVQQILNAGLAYYLNNTKWPTDIAKDLQGNGTTTGGYLPSAVTIVNPWAASYYIGNTGSTSTSAPNAIFAVCTTINAGSATASISQTLAGRLPMAYIVDGDHSADCTTAIPSATVCTTPPCCTGKSCTIVATVNVPGQNLNNARSVNFAGIYSHGGCVASPACPPNMIPQIFVTPASVSGMNSTTSTVYPVSSFTAYVAGSTPVANPSPCNSWETNTPNCQSGTGAAGGIYWRVCAQIITTNGQVIYNSTTGGAASKIMAITRCAPNGESSVGSVSGSGINVFAY